MAGTDFLGTNGIKPGGSINLAVIFQASRMMRDLGKVSNFWP